jgi:hypothetical protein
MTRLVPGIVVLLVLGGAPGRGQVQPPATASIGGAVLVVAQPPHPARRVTVQLNGAGLAVPRLALTDDVGRFAFGGLRAGRYTVTASRAGYVPAAYGAARGWRSTGRPIVLTAGERRTGVEIRMLRGAVLTGRIRDEWGRPAAGVRVRVGELRTRAGVLTFLDAPGRPIVTDDRGVYRAFGLPPGQYVVAAVPSVSMRRVIEAPGAERGAHVGYAPVYFPGTPEPTSAEVVGLAAGEERSGLDFEVRAVRMSTVSGVVRLPSGDAAVRATVRAELADREVGSLLGRLASPVTATDTAGGFTLRNVPPGRHRIQAQLRGQSGLLWSHGLVVADGRPIRDVTLALESAIVVSGRLIVEGLPDGPLPETWRQARVFLQPWTPGGPAGRASVAPGADGAFRFSGVVPGTYDVTVSAPGRGDEWMVASARAGGVDLLKTSLEVEPGGLTTGVTITVTSEVGVISGRLTDASGAPSPEYVLLVFPADRERWRAGAHQLREPIRLEPDGRYRVSGLRPGEYCVAAVTDVGQDDHLDPTFLEALSAGAIRVSLARGEHKVQDIQLAGR